MLCPVTIEEYKSKCLEEFLIFPATELTGIESDTHRVIYHGELFPQVEL